jgi:hypothetical protein
VGPKVVVASQVAKQKRKRDVDMEEVQVTDGTQGGGPETLHLARRQDVMYEDLQEVQARAAVPVVAHDPKAAAAPGAAAGAAADATHLALPMVSTLIDPWSYTGTVENLFYFSFLVKASFAAVFWARPAAAPADAPHEPYIRVFNQDEYNAHMTGDAVGKDAAGVAGAAGAGAGASAAAALAKRVTPQAKDKMAAQAAKLKIIGRSSQFIVEIDQASWQSLIAQKSIKAPCLRHRKYADCRGCDGKPHALQVEAKQPVVRVQDDDN